MPLTYSISDGLRLNVLSYVALNLLYNLLAPADKQKSVACDDRAGGASYFEAGAYLKSTAEPFRK